MPTEHDRLQEWLDARNCTFKDVLFSMRYERSQAARDYRDKTPFHTFFKWRFAQRFGVEDTLHIFDLPEHQAQQIGRESWSDAIFFPERTSARAAVNGEVTGGRMPRADSLKCHGCDRQAQVYHHQSYLPEDRLCVVPLCHSCHRFHHSGGKPLTFGVVPTHVGLIRIAISN